MIYSPFLFISLPLMLSCMSAFFLYGAPKAFFVNTFLVFCVLVFLTLIMEMGLRFFKVNIQIDPKSFLKDTPHSTGVLLLGFFIFFFCLIDLYIRGPLLFTNPKVYHIFTPTESYIRYVTIMCWILIPISFLCTNNKIIRYVFTTTAFLFPILAVDRNRLMSAFYVSFITFIIINQEKISIKKIISVFGVFFTIFIVSFSFIGNKRNNSFNLVILKRMQDPLFQRQDLLARKLKYKEFSTLDVENMIPLKSDSFVFHKAPLVFKWIAVYCSASIFNFSTILNHGYRDTNYLNYQLFHLFKSNVLKNPKDFTPLPTPLPVLNVGTEFLPFVLYGGVPLVILSFFLLCIIYLSYLVLFLKHSSNIFLFLGFLKLSYCCLVLGFAPQFFTFTHLGFLLLMIFLYKVCDSKILLNWFDILVTYDPLCRRLRGG